MVGRRELLAQGRSLGYRCNGGYFNLSDLSFIEKHIVWQ